METFNTIEFDTAAIEAQFLEAERLLFDPAAKCEITYRDFDAETFDALNRPFLESIKNKDLVYCLWTGHDLPAPKYVGHASRSISMQRMRAHLAKKNERTGSQLDRIKAALSNGESVAVSYIVVDPPYMRKALEEWLIEKHSEMLEWNRIGKVKMKSPLITAIDGN